MERVIELLDVGNRKCKVIIVITIITAITTQAYHHSIVESKMKMGDTLAVASKPATNVAQQ